MDAREVVVKTALSIEERGDGRVFAARLKELGLTAYGQSPAEAKSKVKRQFNTLINEYRKLGLLEQRLNRVGVEWRWRDEYSDENAPIEETAPDSPVVRESGMEFRPMNTTTAMAA